MNWDWVRHGCIYWFNFWRLAFAVLVGKAWFFVALAGFLPLLRAARQYEAQGRVGVTEPHRGGGSPPYDPARLEDRIRRW